MCFLKYSFFHCYLNNKPFAENVRKRPEYSLKAAEYGFEESSTAKICILVKKFRYSGACDYYYTSIDEKNGLNDLSIFPNPANSYIGFSYTNPQWKEASIELQDALGRTVLKQPFANSLDISSLTQGLYVVTVKNDKGLRSFKIMKE